MGLLVLKVRKTILSFLLNFLFLFVNLCIDWADAKQFHLNLIVGFVDFQDWDGQSFKNLQHLRLLLYSKRL